jgi:hypothetical protein
MACISQLGGRNSCPRRAVTEICDDGLVGRGNDLRALVEWLSIKYPPG